MTSLRASAETNALRHPKFVLYWIAIGCASFAVQIMSVSVGWEIYDITRDPLYLGYVGLAQFLPPLLLVLVFVQIKQVAIPEPHLLMGVALVRRDPIP